MSLRYVSPVVVALMLGVLPRCSCGPDDARAPDDGAHPDAGSIIQDAGEEETDAGPALPNPTNDEKFCLFQVHCSSRDPFPSTTVVECLTTLRRYRTGELAPEFSTELPPRVADAIACASHSTTCAEYEECFVPAKYQDWCQTHQATASCDGETAVVECAADRPPRILPCPPGTHCDEGTCTYGFRCQAAGTTCVNNVLLTCAGPGQVPKARVCPDPMSYCAQTTNPQGAACTGRVGCSTPGVGDCDGTSGLFVCVVSGAWRYSREFACSDAGWVCGTVDGGDRCVPPNHECDPFAWQDSCASGRITTCENGLRTDVDCRWIGARDCATDAPRCR